MPITVNLSIYSKKYLPILFQIMRYLTPGAVKEKSRQEYLRIIGCLRDRGAEGIIEGCTEIAMLIQQKHTTIPLFDTTTIHAEKAVQMALL